MRTRCITVISCVRICSLGKINLDRGKTFRPLPFSTDIKNLGARNYAWESHRQWNKRNLNPCRCVYIVYILSYTNSKHRYPNQLITMPVGEQDVPDVFCKTTSTKSKTKTNTMKNKETVSRFTYSSIKTVWFYLNNIIFRHFLHEQLVLWVLRHCIFSLRFDLMWFLFSKSMTFVLIWMCSFSFSFTSYANLHVIVSTGSSRYVLFIWLAIRSCTHEY